MATVSDSVPDPPTDPYDMLLAHNQWATHVVLDLCAGLTHEQFTASFPIGPGQNGGLRATLIHILGAMRFWCDRIGDVSPRPWPKFDGVSVPSLRADIDAAGLELAAIIPVVRANPTRIVSMTNEGKHFEFPAACALLHLLTHGHYHRAQCLNMLRRLNVPGISDKLPDLDVVDWHLTTQSPR